MTSSSTSDLQVRLRNLFLKQNHTDCSFRIDDTIIHTHKLILAASSSVFDAMFYGSMAESHTVHITDISLETFKMLLVYIYTDEIHNVTETNVDNLLELYYCAEKYLINELSTKCCYLIKCSLNQQNILRTLDLAVRMGFDAIFRIGIDFFTKCCLSCSSFSSVFQQNYFHISKKCLNNILDCDVKQPNMNLVYLIREWCKVETENLGLEFEFTLDDLNISKAIKDDLENMKSLSFTQNLFQNNERTWILCMRTNLKSVRPLKIGYDSGYTTTLTTDHFVVLKSLILNSRLKPFIRNSPHTYTESVRVNVRIKGNLMHSEKFVICDVEFNSSVHLIFESTMFLSPLIEYEFEFQWDDYALGCEYPKSMMTLFEKTDLCTLTFDQTFSRNGLCNLFGSILNAIEYFALS